MGLHIPKECRKFTRNVRQFFSTGEHRSQRCDPQTSGRSRPKLQNKKPKRAKESDISSNEKFQERPEEEGQDSLLHQSVGPSEPGEIRHSPECEVSDSSPEQDELKSEAQPQPPLIRKLSRAKTFNSIRSCASSLRSAASGFRKLVCMPRLTRSEPQLPHHSQDPPVRAYTDLALRSRELQIPEEDIDGPQSIGSEESFSRAPRHHTFPFDKSKMSKSQALIELRAELEKRRETSEDFNHIWENEALPHLREIIHTDYSISIQAEYGGSRIRRVVEVMTETEIPQEGNRKLTETVSKVFGENPSLKVEISFTVGNIKRSTCTEDECVPPGNPGHHFPLMIGDSVDYQGGTSAGTIGPALDCGGKTGCLVNYHLFEGAPQLNEVQHDNEVPDCHLVHPASIDCAEGERPRIIGKLRAHSGFPIYKTQRHSGSLEKHFQLPRDQAKIQTDWAFCDLQTPLENRMRYSPSEREFQEHSGLIHRVYQGNPRLRIIRSSGRTSGIRYAVVCETPVAVRQGGIETREWCLENIPKLLSTDQWITGGVGIPGDSGAAIVDDKTRELVGQLWGRNVYEGDTNIQRITYFTHIADIFDDIRERYPEIDEVKLAGAPSIPTSNLRTNGKTAHNKPKVTFKISQDGVQRSHLQASEPIEHFLHPATSKSSFTSSTGSSATCIDPPCTSVEFRAMDKEMGIMQTSAPSTVT